MRRKLTFCLAVVAALSLSLNLGAADAAAPAPLPSYLTAHVSIKSPENLLEELDVFLAAATDGTKNPIPAGLVTMLAGMYMPFPPDAWRFGEEAHILFPTEDSGADGPVIVIQADDFDKFLTALKDNGVEVEDDAEATEELGGRVAAVSLPNMGEILAFDLGDNRIGIGQDAESLKAILRPEGGDSWKAWPHFGDADATIDISLAGLWKGFDLERAMANLETGESEVMQKAAESSVKINPEVIKGFFAMFRKFLPDFREEALKTRNASIDVRVNEERVVLGFRGNSEPGSLMDRYAAAAAKLGNVQNDLADRIPAGPLFLSVGAPAADILPADIRDRLAPYVADLLGMPFPVQKAALEKMLADLLAQGDAGKVVATYVDEAGPYNVTWLKSSNAAALLASIDDSMRLLNDMLAAAAEAPGIGISFASEKGESEGKAYTRYYVKLAEDSAIGKLVAGEGEESAAAARRVLAQLENFSIYAGSEKGTVVVVSGAADEDDYLAALGDMDGDGEAMFGTDAAKRVIGYLPRRQAGLALVDVDMIFPFVSEQLAAMRRASGDEDDLVVRALDEAVADMEESGEVIGISAGAQYGQPLIELAVPAKAVNGLVSDYETFRAKMSEILAEEMPSDDAAGEMDGDDADGDQGAENGDVPEEEAENGEAGK